MKSEVFLWSIKNVANKQERNRRYPNVREQNHRDISKEYIQELLNVESENQTG